MTRISPVTCSTNKKRVTFREARSAPKALPWRHGDTIFDIGFSHIELACWFFSEGLLLQGVKKNVLIQQVIRVVNSDCWRQPINNYRSCGWEDKRQKVTRRSQNHFVVRVANPHMPQLLKCMADYQSAPREEIFLIPERWANGSHCARGLCNKPALLSINFTKASTTFGSKWLPAPAWMCASVFSGDQAAR